MYSDLRAQDSINPQGNETLFAYPIAIRCGRSGFFPLGQRRPLVHNSRRDRSMHEALKYCIFCGIDMYYKELYLHGYQSLNLVDFYLAFQKRRPMHANSSQGNQNAKTMNENCNPISQKLMLMCPPAFFFLPDAVAVAVLSPPPMVTVPMTTMPVPLGARLRMSPPTVTLPPAVSV